MPDKFFQIAFKINSCDKWEERSAKSGLVLSACPLSDYGFKLSEDLSLQVCVPDPEFLGNLYTPPVPCPVGTTYRRSKGWDKAVKRNNMSCEFMGLQQ